MPDVGEFAIAICHVTGAAFELAFRQIAYRSRFADAEDNLRQATDHRTLSGCHALVNDDASAFYD
jgi:hypothetical protein